ncbi:hypothetical protein [Trinickia acidisoli]|uniref:hypothetical protein n=1 Tax=Trinickia acidisoli TaxID=2767482 RepID=UPI001A8DCE3F|nr:hypothetical protein [Trinickia acidisoli]
MTYARGSQSFAIDYDASLTDAEQSLSNNRAIAFDKGLLDKTFELMTKHGGKSVMGGRRCLLADAACIENGWKLFTGMARSHAGLASEWHVYEVYGCHVYVKDRYMNHLPIGQRHHGLLPVTAFQFAVATRYRGRQYT